MAKKPRTVNAQCSMLKKNNAQPTNSQRRANSQRGNAGRNRAVTPNAGMEANVGVEASATFKHTSKPLTGSKRPQHGNNAPLPPDAKAPAPVQSHPVSFKRHQATLGAQMCPQARAPTPNNGDSSMGGPRAASSHSVAPNANPNPRQSLAEAEGAPQGQNHSSAGEKPLFLDWVRNLEPPRQQNKYAPKCPKGPAGHLNGESESALPRYKMR